MQDAVLKTNANLIMIKKSPEGEESILFSIEICFGRSFLVYIKTPLKSRGYTCLCVKPYEHF